MPLLSEREEHEQSLFLDFARAAHLGVEPGSVASGRERQPDIRCTIAGGGYFFELARLLDKVDAAFRLKLVREAPKPVTPPPLESLKLAEREILRQKLAKTYETGGLRVDLVLYYDWGPWAGPLVSVPPPGGLGPEFTAAVIEPELAEGLGPFERVWYFARQPGRVLRKYERADCAR